MQVLHCISVLHTLVVSVNILQETGIGRTVNGLCKSEAASVRAAAKGLVNKWKALVVNESEDEPAPKPSQEEHHSHVRDSERHKKDHGKTSHRDLSSTKEKHKSSSEKHRHGGDKSDRKRSGTGEDTRDRSSKRHRTEKREQPDKTEQEIDGSEGTSFADALAMMDGPGRSPVKQTKTNSSRSAATASTSSHNTSLDGGGGDGNRESSRHNGSLNKSVQSHRSGTSSNSSSAHSSFKVASTSSTKGSSSSKNIRSSESSSGPPKLLASSAKLAPLLDPEELKKDILGPSVIIGNSYTPTSYLNPVNIAGVSAAIMKNKRPVGPSTAPVVDPNNFDIIQSKARTKVYSGNKSAATVLSLHEMCIRVLQKNVDYLEYTGGVPFEILEPILLKCTANQLDQIEYYNPYLSEDTNELWKIHVQRQCRGKKRLEMESWREMYQVSLRERSINLGFINITIIHPPVALPTRRTGATVQPHRVYQAFTTDFVAGEADQVGVHGQANSAHGTQTNRRQWWWWWRA